MAPDNDNRRMMGTGKSSRGIATGVAPRYFLALRYFAPRFLIALGLFVATCFAACSNDSKTFTPDGKSDSGAAAAGDDSDSTDSDGAEGTESGGDNGGGSGSPSGNADETESGGEPSSGDPSSPNQPNATDDGSPSEPGAVQPQSQEPIQSDPPPITGGWLDHKSYLVPSDGSRSLGDSGKRLDDGSGGNQTRDTGSKIVFFDKEAGDNESADVYWWDGEQLIDSSGSATNADGEAYGTDPLEPNEDAIKPFAIAAGIRPNAPGDPRLRTHADGFEALAGGYPDWFLFRRGQNHNQFDGAFIGGRSEDEPMVVGAYGPPRDGRALMTFDGEGFEFEGEMRGTLNPFDAHNFGAAESMIHHVLLSLELRGLWSHLGAHLADSPNGGPVTAYAEDCKWTGGRAGINYPPKKFTVRRSILTNRWDADEHNQAYFTNDYENIGTFDEAIFYRNGFKADPMVDPDPRRDVFSRSVYQGGGAQMGHTYRGIISADGASGGPQMRLGGTCENSLILEGYWFSSTRSNNPSNPWMAEGGQSGQSALVRNNVQFVYQYPTPADPDPMALSDVAAQPGWGYTLQGASFGAVVENNIISGVMLQEQLGANQSNGSGITLVPEPDMYQDGQVYTMREDVLRGNIVYNRGIGLELKGDWTGTEDIVVEDNVFVADRPLLNTTAALGGTDQLLVDGNRFYASGDLPPDAIVGDDNAQAGMGDAAKSEDWPDPERTLLQYVTEELGMELLDWEDDPFVDPAGASERQAAGEVYDPTGMKTFMAVATNMRKGGRQAAPEGEKPDWNGDYAWDERFTGPAVVNWVRAGFGMDPVD